MSCITDLVSNMYNPFKQADGLSVYSVFDIFQKVDFCVAFY